VKAAPERLVERAGEADERARAELFDRPPPKPCSARPAGRTWCHTTASGIPSAEAVLVEVPVPIEDVARNGYTPTRLAVTPGQSPLRAPHQAALARCPPGGVRGRLRCDQPGSHRKDEPTAWQGLWRWIWPLYGALALIATLPHEETLTRSRPATSTDAGPSLWCLCRSQDTEQSTRPWCVDGSHGDGEGASLERNAGRDQLWGWRRGPLGSVSVPGDLVGRVRWYLRNGVFDRHLEEVLAEPCSRGRPRDPVSVGAAVHNLERGRVEAGTVARM